MDRVSDLPNRSRMLPLAGTMLALACSTAPPPETGEGAAVLFRGGQVLDGTGNPWVRGDVLVVGDRIARVGVIPAAEVPADAGEVDAAVGGGAAAGHFGDCAHLRGGVGRIEDEGGVSGGRVGEGGNDEGALGADGLQKGIDDGFGSALDESNAAEGAVDHEEVAGADAEREEIADEVGKA